MYMYLQHGRVKVRSSEEQDRARKKERDDKASAYKTVMAQIFNKVGVVNMWVWSNTCSSFLARVWLP